MKKYFLSLFASLLIVSAFAQTTAKNAYQIRVKVDGFTEKQLFLGYYMGDKQYVMDTALVDAKGEFVFSGTEALKGGMYIIVLPPNNDFFQILVTDKEQSFFVRTTKDKPGENVKFEGSKENSLFYDYVNYLNAKRPEAEALGKEIEAESMTFEGAIVFDPVPKVEYEALATKDYMSLYPSSIMHKNMSHETIIENPIYDNLPNIKYYNAQFKDSDGSIQYRRYAQIDNKLGVIPTILDNLLKERKLIKKKMNNEKDPFKYKILDAKQFAVKITANSLYGQLGAATSPIFKRDIAACTTSTGREMLILAKKYDEEILPLIINTLKYYHKNLRKKY
jgi:hypothetical protein